MKKKMKKMVMLLLCFLLTATTCYIPATVHVNNPVSMSPLSGDRKPQIRF